MPDKIVVLSDPAKSMGGVMTRFKLHLFGYENICFNEKNECFNWVKIHEDFMPYTGLIVLDCSSIYELTESIFMFYEYFVANSKKNHILAILSDMDDAQGLLDLLPASMHGAFSVTDNAHLIAEISCLLRTNKDSSSSFGGR